MSVLLGAGIFYFWWRLMRNKPVMKSWKIITLSVIIVAFAIFLAIRPFWFLGQILGFVLVLYVLALWYKQIKVVSVQEVG
jgi:hypothetical protein